MKFFISALMFNHSVTPNLAIVYIYEHILGQPELCNLRDISLL